MQNIRYARYSTIQLKLAWKLPVRGRGWRRMYLATNLLIRGIDHVKLTPMNAAGLSMVIANGGWFEKFTVVAAYFATRRMKDPRALTTESGYRLDKWSRDRMLVRLFVPSRY
jgi:hypothetical protein